MLPILKRFSKHDFAISVLVLIFFMRVSLVAYSKTPDFLGGRKRVTLPEPGIERWGILKLRVGADNGGPSSYLSAVHGLSAVYPSRCLPDYLLFSVTSP